MSSTRSILLLEDDEKHIARFRQLVAELGAGLELKVWRDTHSMLAECEPFFARATLICLNDAPNSQPETQTVTDTEPDLSTFLGDFLPVCPVRLFVLSFSVQRTHLIVNSFHPILGPRWVLIHSVSHCS